MNTNKTKQVWDNHYTRDRSILTYPDENLVRILSKIQPNLISTYNTDSQSLCAMDFGCGSGRHTALLNSMGWDVLAVDYSRKSIEMVQTLLPTVKTAIVEEPPYPMDSNSMHAIIAWGVLHYNSESLINHMIEEFKRILKPGGYFIGTIRSNNDTALSPDKLSSIQTEDLKGGYIKLFSELELTHLLKSFESIQIGYMERTPIGEMDKKIAHYFFLAQKQL